MNSPVMLEASTIATDITSLTAYLPVPGFGVLPVNAFVLHATEPVLVYWAPIHQAIRILNDIKEGR